MDEILRGNPFLSESGPAIVTVELDAQGHDDDGGGQLEGDQLTTRYLKSEDQMLLLDKFHQENSDKLSIIPELGQHLTHEFLPSLNDMFASSRSSPSCFQTGSQFGQNILSNSPAFFQESIQFISTSQGEEKFSSNLEENPIETPPSKSVKTEMKFSPFTQFEDDDILYGKNDNIKTPSSPESNFLISSSVDPPTSPGVYLSEALVDSGSTPVKLTHDPRLTKQNREPGFALKSSVPKLKKKNHKTDRNSIESRRDTFRDRTEKLGFVQTGVLHSYNQYVKGSLLVAERPQREGLSGRFLIQKCGDFPGDLVVLPEGLDPAKDLTQIDLNSNQAKYTWEKKQFAKPKQTVGAQRAGFNWRMKTLHNRLCNASQTIGTGFFMCFLVVENGEQALRYFNFGEALENNRVTLATGDQKFLISEILPPQILKAKAELNSFLKSPEVSAIKKRKPELFIRIYEGKDQVPDIQKESATSQQISPQQSFSQATGESLLIKSLCLANNDPPLTLETPQKLIRKPVKRKAVKRRLDLGKQSEEGPSAKRSANVEDVSKVQLRLATKNTDDTEDIINIEGMEKEDELGRLLKLIFENKPKPKPKNVKVKSDAKKVPDKTDDKKVPAKNDAKKVPKPTNVKVKSDAKKVPDKTDAKKVTAKKDAKKVPAKTDAKKVPASFVLKDEFLDDSDEPLETDDVEDAGPLRVFKKVSKFLEFEEIEDMLDSDL